MNRKQFIILLVFAAVIGTAGLIVHQQRNRSWQGAGASLGRKLLPGLAVNDIAQISIRSGTNVLDLAKSDNFWRVRERGSYPADFSAISDLLLKFADLKIIQSQEVGPSQLGRFELLPPGSATNAGTLIEFKDSGGKVLNTVLLGKKHLKQTAGNPQFAGLGDEGWPDGRYVMVGTGAKTLDVISDPLDNVQPNPARWLDKEFFSIEKPRAIAVQFPAATNSWKLARASLTNDWQLADAGAGEKLDPAKISSVTSPFSSASFNDVAPTNQTENADQTNTAVLTVETFDGFSYVARIGGKHADDYPVSFTLTASLPAARVPAEDEKPADKARLDKEFKAQADKLSAKLAKEKKLEGWIYSVPAYSIDPILKTRGQLLAETRTNEPPQAAKK
jgi:Domain of unknown function (DUF4340)